MDRRKLLTAAGAVGLAIATVPTASSLAATTEKEVQAEPGPLQVSVTLTELSTAESPTAGTAGPNGTIWIGERAGTVRVLDDQGLSEPVVDITGETTTDGERGVAGMTFNPDFTRFYLSYTDINGHNTVDEFDVVDGEVQVDTRQTIFFQEQPGAAHNSGHLNFGPDGMLYISIGDGDFSVDGDPFDNAQNLGTLLGAVLRLDVDAGGGYEIPADNPFVDDPAAQDEIWAYGLRNPWQFSFDAETGDMWIGDVGNLEREEVNFVPAGTAGANYGWPHLEGTMPLRPGEPDDHVLPVHEWEHAGGGVCWSVTGGFVYRGSAIPELQGWYVFSDYCDGVVRAIQLQNGQVVDEATLASGAGWPSAFVQGSDNELYVLDMGGFGGGGGTPVGAIFRIDPA